MQPDRSKPSTQNPAAPNQAPSNPDRLRVLPNRHKSSFPQIHGRSSMNLDIFETNFYSFANVLRLKSEDIVINNHIAATQGTRFSGNNNDTNDTRIPKNNIDTAPILPINDTLRTLKAFLSACYQGTSGQEITSFTDEIRRGVIQTEEHIRFGLQDLGQLTSGGQSEVIKRCLDYVSFRSTAAPTVVGYDVSASDATVAAHFQTQPVDHVRSPNPLPQHVRSPSPLPVRPLIRDIISNTNHPGPTVSSMNRHPIPVTPRKHSTPSIQHATPQNNASSPQNPDPSPFQNYTYNPEKQHATLVHQPSPSILPSSLHDHPSSQYQPSTSNNHLSASQNQLATVPDHSALLSHAVNNALGNPEAISVHLAAPNAGATNTPSNVLGLVLDYEAHSPEDPYKIHRFFKTKGSPKPELSFNFYQSVSQSDLAVPLVSKEALRHGDIYVHYNLNKGDSQLTKTGQLWQWHTIHNWINYTAEYLKIHPKIKHPRIMERYLYFASSAPRDPNYVTAGHWQKRKREFSEG